MKKLFPFVLAACLLLAPAAAHAYAIYNHTAYTLCAISTAGSILMTCKFKVPPHSTYNGAHGSGLKHINLYWYVTDLKCQGSDEFSIPDGGFARVYEHHVEIYQHKGGEMPSVEVTPTACNFEK